MSASNYSFEKYGIKGTRYLLSWTNTDVTGYFLIFYSLKMSYLLCSPEEWDIQVNKFTYCKKNVTQLLNTRYHMILIPNFFGHILKIIKVIKFIRWGWIKCYNTKKYLSWKEINEDCFQHCYYYCVWGVRS